ncbi:MAG: pseudaminic acid biosynthesis-associated methylase [Verrucomicrobia bacterium]|nr:pseudaminic acid biosynthesis-associated methylase [Verrucomicrobiota bacterium]
MNDVMTPYKTEQEAFWAGDFGDDYIGRNEPVAEYMAGQLFFFARALEKVRPAPASLCELGANIGLNLRALKLLFPHAHQSCVEINAQAVARLRRDGVGDEVVHDSILNFTPTRQSELVLIKGVMIHLNPGVLPEVYRKLAACSSRHVLIAEYYNRRPEEVAYRNHQGRMFRRDFGGEFMDACPEFALADYGFSYHRDPREQQDDITWFLFERRG